MKYRTALWVAVVIGLALAGSVCPAADVDEAVATPYPGHSGNERGFKVVSPAYDAVLWCNDDYGLSFFFVNMGGEEVMRTRRFAIYDDKNKCAFDPFEFRKDKTEFVPTSSPGKIAWQLSTDCAEKKGIEYGGSLAYETRKIVLTHNWTLRSEIKGRFLVGNLKLGIPLLTGCPFEATLADGTVAKGAIPAELPKEQARFTPYAAGKAITSILFDTKKGKVRITFVPDKHLDITKGNRLLLQTILHTYPDREPYRRYELCLDFPLGKTKDVPRSYSVVFEFPE